MASRFWQMDEDAIHIPCRRLCGRSVQLRGFWVPDRSTLSSVRNHRKVFQSAGLETSCSHIFTLSSLERGLPMTDGTQRALAGLTPPRGLWPGPLAPHATPRTSRTTRPRPLGPPSALHTLSSRPARPLLRHGHSVRTLRTVSLRPYKHPVPLVLQPLSQVRALNLRNAGTSPAAHHPDYPRSTHPWHTAGSWSEPLPAGVCSRQRTNHKITSREEGRVGTCALP